MKYFLPFLILLSGCSILGSHKSVYTPLNGDWYPIDQKFAGLQFPESTYATQRLMLRDSSYILSSEVVDSGKMICSDSTMDIYGIEGPNAGNHFMAIYKLRNDTLTISYNLTGGSYPDTFVSDSTNYYFVSIFVRAKD
ncbi:MAG TPA: hypothetical protein PK511_02560 [Chitinophagales bacterium]|nr:hypothetical protein [Chitinophagales bacterium]HMU68843.1 hypothetical protein [Chitinophagales bacterium]HMX04098.1 hypothetical protein [Chitinophagales bacterium]HMZ89425.1 hypothetical protein [Chitinophagales bacterium]HNA57014.1 hypothetical protein [Chitinophagales bacterium]